MTTDDTRTQNNALRHKYRPLSDREKLQVEEIKTKGDALLDAIKAPHQTREMSLAVTKVEEAVMWAVKGVTG